MDVEILGISPRMGTAGAGDHAGMGPEILLPELRLRQPFFALASRVAIIRLHRHSRRDV